MCNIINRPREAVEQTADNKSICPFLLLRAAGTTREDDNDANYLTNLRKAIGNAITDFNEAGIVRDIMNWISAKDEITSSFNGFVKTSKHLGASSLLTAIKEQCRAKDIPVAYVAFGLPENKNGIVSDKLYCRVKDLLTKDDLDEEDILKFFTAAFNLSNVIDGLGAMCRQLKNFTKSLDNDKPVKIIIDFFRKNLNSIKDAYCKKFLSESSEASKNFFNFNNNDKINYDEAYNVFEAYKKIYEDIGYVKKSEEVQYKDNRVDSIKSDRNTNIVILIDDFELAVKAMIGNNLLEGKNLFDNAKKFIDIIKSINENDIGVKFVVPIRSRIYDIGDSKSEKKPLYLSKGWEQLFEQDNKQKLMDILKSLDNSSEEGYKCATKCEFNWDGNNNIFSKGKIGEFVKLCDKNPYYLFRSLFLAHKGESDGSCTINADRKIKKYFTEQFKDDIFELLSLYLLESINDEESLKNLTLSNVVEAAIHWVNEFVNHKFICDEANYEYRICTIYAREKVSTQDEGHGKLLGDKRVRKAIINALQDVGVIKIRTNNNPPIGCTNLCSRSSSKLYAKYYNSSGYKSFKEFFNENYTSNKKNDINIKEYHLHPFINYIFSDKTIFAKGEAA